MDLNNIPLIGMLVRRMDFLGTRQRVIAQNVANADTPGYVPHDLSEESFARQMQREFGSGGPGHAERNQLAATAAGHMAGTTSGRAGEKRSPISKHYEESPSGNAVVLEEEMARLSENQMDYDTITSIYRKQVQMLKSALRGPSS
ncbi:flagellar basal body rod protein FlgB [Zavarzinia compransoris]|uniref:flagellar basal body rod protein FlgB n=1 Tax=Zavarzinia marina TaxID=2911065 RepID=UPI001F2FAA7F|nr:flagellar basal body rod protein FlgB [Zavarzinia marina]MCF4166567.1 flagellar basal body rod protein FlgB [Zavarzinia marina]